MKHLAYTGETQGRQDDAGALVVRKEVEATSRPWCCLPCPKGSDCTGGAHVEPKANYWRGSPMWCLVDVNLSTGGKTEFAACDSTVAALLAADATAHDGRRSDGGVGGGYNGSIVRKVETFYKCPAKMCTEAVDDSSTSRCRAGHTGVACASCLRGFAMKKGQCIACNISTGKDEISQVGNTVIAYVYQSVTE